MEWSRGPIIGRGSTATVSLATALRSGELFAVKSTELSSSAFLQREESFLSKLSCPRIVKYLGFFISNENNVPLYNLCMEYVPGGTISDAIRRRGGKLEESAIRSYTHQILQGLDHLHADGLVHCDIKSQNVLIGEDGAKIADFGCARVVGVDGSEFSGTPVFMAPEVARGEEQGFAADIWALGCTIIEMATGRCPWPEANDPVSALYRIGYSGDAPEFPRWFSDNGKDFLSKCLRRNAKERWTAKQLLRHPFVGSLGGYRSDQAKEFTMISPSSVLDQELWDSLEELESPREPTIEGSSSILNSPMERIKKLIGFGGAFSSPPNVPNWSLDGNWVTVRCNIDTENRQNFTDENGDIFADESISGSSSSFMDSNEDLSSNYSFELVSIVGNERDFLIPCNNMEEVTFVPENIKIETDCKRFCFIQSKCYSICLNPLQLYFLFTFSCCTFFLYLFPFTCYSPASILQGRGNWKTFEFSNLKPMGKRLFPELLDNKLICGSIPLQGRYMCVNVRNFCSEIGRSNLYFYNNFLFPLYTCQF